MLYRCVIQHLVFSRRILNWFRASTCATASNFTSRRRLMEPFHLQVGDSIHATIRRTSRGTGSPRFGQEVGAGNGIHSNRDSMTALLSFPFLHALIKSTSKISFLSLLLPGDKAGEMLGSHRGRRAIDDEVNGTGTDRVFALCPSTLHIMRVPDNIDARWLCVSIVVTQEYEEIEAYEYKNYERSSIGWGPKPTGHLFAPWPPRFLDHARLWWHRYKLVLC